MASYRAGRVWNPYRGTATISISEQRRIERARSFRARRQKLQKVKEERALRWREDQVKALRLIDDLLKSSNDARISLSQVAELLNGTGIRYKGESRWKPIFVRRFLRTMVKRGYC